MTGTHDAAEADAGGAVRRLSGPSPVALALDLAALLAVPAALAAALALPRADRLALALRYEEPTVLAAFASHFVHADATHLAANLAVYALVVPVTYVLCLRSGRRTEFFVTFATFVVAFPFALSALNVLLVRPRAGLGFSGVNMAFLGFLPTALFHYLSVRVTDAVGLDDSPLLFFAGATAIVLLAVPVRPVTLGVAAGSTLLALVYLRSAVAGAGGEQSVPADFRRAFGRTGALELPVVAVAVFAFVPTAAFPSNPAAGGEVLNLFSHLLGYCLGFIVPYVTFRLTGPIDG